MEKELTIKRIHHIEFIVGNALQAASYYRTTFGFNQIGYLGPETGHPDCASYVLQQDRIRLVFTSPLSHEDPRNVFLLLHGAFDKYHYVYHYVFHTGSHIAEWCNLIRSGHDRFL